MLAQLPRVVKSARGDRAAARMSGLVTAMLLPPLCLWVYLLLQIEVLVALTGC